MGVYTKVGAMALQVMPYFPHSQASWRVYDPYLFGSKEEIQAMLNKRVDAANAAHPEHEGGHVSCPGQRTISTREKSMKDGVSVDEAIWEQICALAAGNMETKDIASK